MKIKFKHQVIYWVYLWMLLTIIVGVIHGFWGIAFTRRLNKIMKMTLLVVVYLQVAMFRIGIWKDSLLLILFVLYELVISGIRGVFIFPDMFVDILTWPGLYLIFQTYTSQRPLPEEFKETTVAGLTMICLLSLVSIYKHRTGDGNYGGVIFYLYYALTLMPMVLYLQISKLWKHIFFIVVIGLLLISTKRAGTVIAGAGYLLYIILEIRSSDRIVNKKRLYRAFAFVLLFAAVMFWIMHQFLSFEIVERLLSIASDGGSGRNSIWIEIMEHFDRADPLVQWFGHGYQAVYYQLQPYGVPRMAHNSFVEFLYDYGYVGLCLFCAFFLAINYKTVYAFKNKLPHNSVLVFSVFTCWILGMSSYLFEESRIMMPIAIAWGCINGERDRLCAERLEKDAM